MDWIRWLWTGNWFPVSINNGWHIVHHTMNTRRYHSEKTRKNMRGCVSVNSIVPIHVSGNYVDTG